MINLIDAPPGSGKTYYVANYLSKFWVYDKLYQEFVMKPDVLIITNIDGLKCKHWNLDYCLKEKTHKEFFSMDNFKNIQKTTGKSHIILAIDEAHKVFPAGYKDPKVYEFFAEHRHIGLDILFMTQGLSEFTRIFNPLYENIMSATPRSKGVAGVFTYTRLSKSGQYLGSEVVRKKDEVFASYTSMTIDEKNKPKNAYVQWIFILVIFFGAGGFLFNSALAGLKTKSAEARDKHKSLNPSPPALPDQQALPAPLASAAPVPSLASVPLPSIPAPDYSYVQDTEVVKWRPYTVDGYVVDGDKTHYMINGRFVDSELCRNFDKHTMKIQYFDSELQKPLAPLVRTAAAMPAVPVALATGK